MALEKCALSLVTHCSSTHRPPWGGGGQGGGSEPEGEYQGFDLFHLGIDKVDTGTEGIATFSSDESPCPSAGETLTEVVTETVLMLITQL